MLAAIEAAEKEAAELDFSQHRYKLEHFLYDKTQDKFWDTRLKVLRNDRALDASISKSEWPTIPDEKGNPKRARPSAALRDDEKGLTVDSSTWWPGKPSIINNIFVDESGVESVSGHRAFNTYKESSRERFQAGGDPQPWIDHVKRLYPDPLEHEHFFDWAAHMLQKPDEKVNHGIVLAGAQGIGKDTMLLPLKRGVGPANHKNLDPDQINDRWGDYKKSLFLVVDEVRPHDDFRKTAAFYNRMKTLLAAPPEVLPMEQKHAKMVYVVNVHRVLLTTNEPKSMYIPQGDRRLFVMTSRLRSPVEHPDTFPKEYFGDLYVKLRNGGLDAAVMWLLNRDISSWRYAKQSPPLTDGKREILDSTAEVRRTTVDDLIDEFIDQVWSGEEPDVIFAKDLDAFAGSFFDDKEEMKNVLKKSNFHYKMDENGYAAVKNPGSERGKWKLGKFESRTAYVKKDLGLDNAASVKLVREHLKDRPLDMPRG